MSALLHRSAILLSAGLLLAGSVAGCASREETPASSGTVAGTETKASAPLTITDQWVKAADSGMTGIFGALKNAGSTAVTVVSATSPAAARVELHEVVGAPGSATMRPKDGGFEIPAGGTHVLAPGADHIMLLDLAAPLRAGEDVAVTLSLADGTTVPFTAQVRDFAGAAENYQPDDQPSAGSHG